MGDQVTMVYAYHAKPATTNLPVVRDQMRLAHRYQNALVAIERDRREQRDAEILRISPQLADIEARILSLDNEREALRTSVKSARVESRAKVKPDAATAAKIKAIGAEIRVLRGERKIERAKVFAADEEGPLAEINEAAYAAVRAARAECGCYWGTYLLAEAAMDVAKKSVTPPRFHPWRGEGAVAVQIQHGMPVDALAGTDNRLRLRENTDARQTLPETPLGRRDAIRKRMVLSMRVASQGPRNEPVWAEIPILMHRPLPAGGVVKWVKLLLRKIGLSERWEVQFTVSMPARGLDTCDGFGCSTNTLAIDVGWRVRRDGLRVATTINHEHDLLLPLSLIEAFERVARIRSERDLLFNVARDRTAEWLSKQVDLPEFFAEKRAHIRSWKSPARLASLALYWRTNRMAGDSDTFGTLEHWRKRDAHLYQYERHLHDQAIARRTDIYRNYSARIASENAVIVIENLRLDKMAILGPVEAENPLHQRARMFRQMACISSLITSIKQSCAKTGAEVREVDAAKTTMECSNCHVSYNFDRLRVRWDCPGCGLQWDQDENAARNIDARGECA